MKQLTNAFYIQSYRLHNIPILAILQNALGSCHSQKTSSESGMLDRVSATEDGYVCSVIFIQSTPSFRYAVAERNVQLAKRRSKLR